MASLRKRLGRRIGWEVEFYALDKRRKAIWLGQITEKKARDFLRFFEDILEAKRSNTSIEKATVAWLSKLEGRLRERLIELGLFDGVSAKAIKPEDRKVGPFTKRYIDERTDATPNTRANYLQAREWLIKSVGENTLLVDISKSDLDRWTRDMKTNGLALTTRNKHIQRVKTMFRAAVDERIISESPADALREERLPKGKRVDRSRQRFISEEISSKILQKLPDDRWKLIFGLLRYCGLRRHEVFVLRWCDVDLDFGRLRICSTKTGERECPIFPEVAPLLRRMLAHAESKAYESDPDCPFDLTTRVIPWTNSPASLTTLLQKRVTSIVGDKDTWPKPCHQLRSTRRTELQERFPPHCVNEWMGHDGSTAEKHYLQVTGDHWQKATVREPKVRPAAGTAIGLENGPAAGPAVTARQESSNDDSNRPEQGEMSSCDDEENSREIMISTPDRIRTYDLSFRKAALYPTELRGHHNCDPISIAEAFLWPKTGLYDSFS